MSYSECHTVHAAAEVFLRTVFVEPTAAALTGALRPCRGAAWAEAK